MEENAIVTFDNNAAFQGGGIWTDNDIKLIFKGNSTAFFYNNLAIEGGGAVKVLSNSNIILKDYIFVELQCSIWWGNIFRYNCSCDC